jgi:hypothetical protein
VSGGGRREEEERGAAGRASADIVTDAWSRTYLSSIQCHWVVCQWILFRRGEEVGKDGPIQLHEEFNEVIHGMHVLEYSYSIPVDRKKGTSHRHRLR